MKILKCILGLVAGLSTVVALFAGGKSKQKVKKIKKDIKVSNKKVKEIKSGIEAIEATQESYKKTLNEMKNKKEAFKPTEMGGKQADKFIKDFLKKRKKNGK